MPSPLRLGLMLQPTRFHTLDAIRGLAAFTVLISHLTVYGLMSNPDLWAILKWTPLRIVWGGHQAVILFFVMSGFSLYLMCERIVFPDSVIRYLLARAFRLYPAYLACLAATAAVLEVTDPTFSLYRKDVLDHVAMIGVFDFNRINPPIWSIIHEMRISLIFPLVFALVRYAPRMTVAVMTAVSLGLSAALWGNTQLSSALQGGPFGQYLLTLHYTTMFVYGAALARFRGELIAVSQTLVETSMARRLAIGTAVFVLYAFPFDNPWDAGQRMAGDLLITFGSIGLILCSFAFSASLSGKTVNFLGRISFSLYLSHYACLKAVVAILGQGAHSALIWAVAIPTSLAIASFLYYAVEAPSLMASRIVRTSGKVTFAKSG